MGDRVVVVTDSTSYLPRGWAVAESISVVPVQVIVAGRPYDETDDDQAEVVSLALEQWQPVTTSRPSPERFLRSFTAAAEAGASHVVAVTLSADLSATYESSRRRKRPFRSRSSPRARSRWAWASRRSPERGWPQPGGVRSRSVT